MKRIEFIQPVESMRGSFGTKQDLKYPANDNKAFEAPEDKRSYARNYQPTFIGAKIARNGLKYFSVKTKSAVRNTASWRMAAALQGGTGAIVGALMVQTVTEAVNVRNYFNNVVLSADLSMTFRKWASAIVRSALAAKQETITFYTGVTIKNPWVTDDYELEINPQVIVKFFPQLGVGTYFTIDGEPCACWQGVENWADYVDIDLNTLGVTIVAVEGTSYAMLNGKYIINAVGTYQIAALNLADGAKYTTTSVAPQP